MNKNNKKNIIEQKCFMNQEEQKKLLNVIILVLYFMYDNVIKTWFRDRGSTKTELSHHMTLRFWAVKVHSF